MAQHPCLQKKYLEMMSVRWMSLVEANQGAISWLGGQKMLREQV